jgi:hypothetical protein
MAFFYCRLSLNLETTAPETLSAICWVLVKPTPNTIAVRTRPTKKPRARVMLFLNCQMTLKANETPLDGDGWLVTL